jgi:hypothetical protein
MSGPKQPTQESAGAPVAQPVPGAKIIVDLKAANGGRCSVIDFPSVRGGLAILGPADNPTVTIDTV